LDPLSVKTIAHYRIVEKLGEGGMGIVYRARDKRLDRDVALKMLTNRSLLDEKARARFTREAKALSKLSHPNIAVIHDFDRHHGTDYLVMEYIPGTTLSDRLGQGPLLEPELLHVAVQLAEGLAAAHQQGIVHRDLKPGNVRVTPDGRAKILDFGLAKPLRPGAAGPGDETSDGSLTGTRAVVGTLPYMAPEQVLGDAVDSRTDIYALGAVLFEMATGRRPYPENQTSRLIYAILYGSPDVPSKLNAAISPDLDEIILRALQKDPVRRFQSAEPLIAELRRLLLEGRRVGEGRPPAREEREARIASIAVLPLENLSGDPAEEYFSDGMTEALIADMARLGGLRVISRTSTMHYKRTTKPLPQVAQELHVDAVLEGSVQRAGGRVRVTAQLIRAATDEHVWTGTYDRDLGDVLSLQSEVARSIADEIAVKLMPHEMERLSRIRPVHPEAHELYLRGRYHWNKRDLEGLKRAIEYFQGAITKDPKYALAYAGLADAYTILGNWSVLKPSQAYPRAKEAAAKALQIDDTLGEAHVALTFAQHLHDWNWVEAERGFRQAIRLSPNYASGHSWYAVFLATWKRHDESIAEAKRSQELDPLGLIINGIASWVHYQARRYEEAMEQAIRLLEMDANFPQTRLFLGLSYMQLGRHEDAIAEYERGVALSGGLTELYAALGYALGASGRHADARGVLDELDRMSAVRYVPPYSRGLVHVGLGETERALELLELSCEHRNTWLILLSVEPMFDSIRADPRFQAIVRRVGLPLTPETHR